MSHIEEVRSFHRGTEATLTTGTDGVPLVFVDTRDGPQDGKGPVLRVRLNDVLIWANPPGPGEPAWLVEQGGDLLPLPHSQDRISDLEFAVNALLADAALVARAWECGDLAEAVRCLAETARCAQPLLGLTLDYGDVLPPGKEATP